MKSMLSRSRALALSRSRALASVSLLMVGGVAQAAFPPGVDTFFDVDHDFSSDVCAPDTKDICKVSTDGKRMDCIPNFADDTTQLGLISYLIRNESDVSSTDICDGYDYCLFGALKTGATTETTYFCGFDGASISKIVLHGSDEADLLWFHYDDNFNWQLEDHPGVTSLQGVIIGGDLGDNIHGSRYTDSAYSEVLRGDGGDDTIDGHAGDDEIHAGSGADVIYAGDGKDSVYLDSGSNAASTEAGNDTVYGGSDVDRVHLGTDNDTAYLGGGQDVACGGAGDDEIHGGGAADSLWGDDDDDDLDGGMPNSGTPADACGSEGAGSKTSCETLLTSPPSDCPPEHAP